MTRYRALLLFFLLAAHVPWYWRLLPADFPQIWHGWSAPLVVSIATSSGLLLLFFVSDLLATRRQRNLAAGMNRQLTAAHERIRTLEATIQQNAADLEEKLTLEREQIRRRTAELDAQCVELQRLREKTEWDLRDRQKKLEAQQLWLDEKGTRLDTSFEEFHDERVGWDHEQRRRQVEFDTREAKLHREQCELAEVVKQHEAELVLRLGKLREGEDSLAGELRALEQTRLVWANQKLAAESSLQKDRDECDYRRAEFEHYKKQTQANLDEKCEWLEERIARLADERDEWEEERRRRERQLCQRSDELRRLASELEQQRRRHAAKLSELENVLDERESALATRENHLLEREQSWTERQRRWENEIAQRAIQLDQQVTHAGASLAAEGNADTGEAGSAENNAIDANCAFMGMGIRGDSLDSNSPSDGSIKHVFLDDGVEQDADDENGEHEEAFDDEPPIAYRLRLLGQKRRERARRSS